MRGLSLEQSREVQVADGRALSIGFMSPSWPIGSSANGIVTHVDVMVRQLEAMGHRTTVLANRLVGDPTSEVYSLTREVDAILRKPLRKFAHRVRSKLDPERASVRLIQQALSGILRRATATKGRPYH